MGEMTFEQAFRHAHDHYAAGRFRDSEVVLLQILAALPDQPDTLQLLGIVTHNLGRGRTGVELVRRAIDLNPNAQFYSNLGVMLAGQNEAEPALEAFRRAIELEPNQAEAHHNIGNLLRSSGRLEEAIAEYRRAVEIRPDYPEARNNLGASLEESGDPEGALVQLRRAVELRAEYPEGLNNLGNVYLRLGRTEEAFDAYRRSLTARPNNAETRTNLGNAYRARNQLNEAMSEYVAALQLRPKFAEAAWGAAFVRLLAGEFEQGFRGLEARWGLKDWPQHWYFAEPTWDGSDLAGKSILLHSEQGLGDTIQFVRYAQLLAARGAAVMLLCQPELKRLMEGQPGIQFVTADGNIRPAANFRCPLLSLPALLGTTLQTVPARVPYLAPDVGLVQQWRQRLEREPAGLKVGIAWAGNPAHRNDRNRSIPLAALAPLAQIPGVRFYSLQKTRPVRDVGATLDNLTDWTADINDMADTAALVANLDVIVSADTAVAHLAGALARPTYVLLPFAPDWRWMLNRGDSPWYPTMRLFRQARPGDWQTPVGELAQHLARSGAKR